MTAVTEIDHAEDGYPIQLYTWTPEGPPRGVVQILHGMVEHAARYGRLAEALNAAGYAVVAHDERGHGGSVRDERDRGHFGDHDGFTVSVGDAGLVAARARKAWPDAPLVLFGHSGGSTQAVLALGRWPERWDAAVLSGPVGVVGPLRLFGLLAAWAERFRLGKRGRSRLLNALSFGDFNKAFTPARTEFDWLSRDPAEVDAYIHDPLCGFLVTTQFWVDQLHALGTIADVRFLGGIRNDLPVYLFAGDKDPVGGAGKQLMPFVRRLEQAGLRDVELRLYEDGRHEMLNDVVRDEVTADLIAWLDDHVGGGVQADG